MSIINKTMARELILETKPALKISEKYWADLEQEIEMLIVRSCERAMQNGRVTLLPKDL
jgi:hypothetical protein